MALRELSPEPEEFIYQESDQSQLKKESRKNLIGRNALHKSGYRLKMIDGPDAIYELRQEGVTRYPPVKVTENPYPHDKSERVELSDEILEIIRDPDGHMRRKYGEKIEKYQQATGLKRVVLAKRYPEVAEYVAYLDAQQSVRDAQISADRNEGRIVIL